MARDLGKTNHTPPQRAPKAVQSPKVPASSVSDPHAEAKAGGADFVGTAKTVVHKGQINTDGWSKTKNR
jgi:hypothetical protein